MPTRVLVVGNHFPNLRLADFVLITAGIWVITAKSAVEAKIALLAFAPDIILMDLQMPDVDGFTAMQRIRANSTFDAVKIVAFAAATLDGDVE